MILNTVFKILNLLVTCRLDKIWQLQHPVLQNSQMSAYAVDEIKDHTVAADVHKAGAYIAKDLINVGDPEATQVAPITR